jgi:SHOCT-like domain
MAASIDERNRILSLVEAGQISASEAAQLLDALVVEQTRPAERNERIQNKTMRIWLTDVSDTAARRQKIKMSAVLPAPLIGASLRLLSRLMPQLNQATIRQLIDAIERGSTGRLLDLQDLEEGQRLEIFVER